MNSYLTIAERVLTQARQPLSAREMLQAAYRLQIVPSELYGKTQHKTLHARLAEDILRNRYRSSFVRTAPGRFFLRRFLSDQSIPDRYRSEYHAPLRADQLKRYTVLCFARTAVTQLQEKFGEKLPLREVAQTRSRYRKLATIREHDEFLFARVAIVLLRGAEIFLRRSTNYFGDALPASRSILVLSYLKREDRSLFSTDEFGVKEAAERTILEHLPLTPAMLADLDVASPSIDPTVVVSTPQEDNGRSVAVVITCRVHVQSSADIALQSIPDSEWSKVPLRINDAASFDPWSRLIINAGILGELARTSGKTPLSARS